jgi:hypothetical protein
LIDVLRNLIVSIVGGQIRGLSVAMGNTVYTVGYEPPLERDNKFLHLGKYACIPARVSGESLMVRWPDGTEATGKIIRRENIHPHRAKPA